VNWKISKISHRKWITFFAR